MPPHAYFGRNDLKAALGTTSTGSDAAYRAVLEGVSRQIDDDLDRTFQPYQGIRYYTARDAWTLDVEDVLAVSLIRMDQAQDRTYGTTLSTKDWELGPYNAALEKRPYARLDIRPNGGYRFYGGRRAVEVTGTWGYWQDLAASSAVLSTAVGATSTSLAVTGSTAFQPQQTILIGSEQLYLGDIDSSSNALVERGVNGTTPVAHTTADAISVYRYPGPIVLATKTQALRIAKRPDAPLGVIAGGLRIEQEVIRIPTLDPDVSKMLETYRRKRYLGV